MRKIILVCVTSLQSFLFAQTFPFEGDYSIAVHSLHGIEYDGTFGDITTQNSDLLKHTDSIHQGTDFVPAEDKVDIVAMLDGVVEDVFAEPGRVQNGITYSGSPQYGGQIVIRHDNGLLTFYGRLSKVLVKIGDTVTEGQKIGELDKDFKSVGYYESGYHLHFEIIIDPFDENSAKLGIDGLPMKSYDTRNIVGVENIYESGVWSHGSFIGYRDSFSDNQGGQVKSNFHRGSDITVPESMQPSIYAFSDGVIHSHYTTNKRLMNGEYLYGNKVFGGCIMIEHEGGYYSMYAHLSDTSGPENSEVKKGDYIGIMGNTGLSSGQHLHFQMNYDPVEYFEKVK